MTATIKPVDRTGRARTRPIRFSSMESLGFSDAASTWSDSPAPVLSPSTGRHLAPPPAPDPLADWHPEAIGRRLDGANFRWSLLVVTLTIIGGLAYGGLWLYQRPAAQAQASVTAVASSAEDLEASLPLLEQFNEALSTADQTADTAGLFTVDDAARALFSASGDSPSTETAIRSDASGAAGSALDGVRLARDAHAYRLAVGPILIAPALETDPTLIELDEAARSFGAWQLHFDEVRTALTDTVLPGVTDQLDILSGDLTAILGDYVDALREDDMTAADAVVAGLSGHLASIEQSLVTAIEDVQTRVRTRIVETRQALASLLG
jgi:hypothetical protein